jgi:DivIVA domain-containing protein
MTLTPDSVRNVTFRNVKRGKNGYDIAEVDAFLDRLEATLRGADNLTAREILQVEFSPRRRGQPGYAKEDVDDFLDTAAVTMRKEIPARPQRPQRDRQREPAAAPSPSQESGYDADQVDTFFDRVQATLRGEDDLTAQDLLTVKFRPAPPGGRSCPKPGVDAFLIQVALSLKQLSSPRQDSAASTTPPPLAAGELQDITFSCPPPGYPAFDQNQVDEFLSRVEAALRGEGRMTAREVAEMTFTAPPAGKRGYAEAEVEAVLDLVEEQLRGVGAWQAAG